MYISGSMKVQGHTTTQDISRVHLLEVTLHLEDEMLHPLEGTFHFGALHMPFHIF
jgi:hypothetical protein